jgi:hypothetical protein
MSILSNKIKFNIFVEYISQYIFNTCKAVKDLYICIIDDIIQEYEMT